MSFVLKPLFHSGNSLFVPYRLIFSRPAPVFCRVIRSSPGSMNGSGLEVFSNLFPLLLLAHKVLGVPPALSSPHFSIYFMEGR